MPWEHDRIARMLQRVQSFEKYHRSLGNRQPGLGCVVAIVKADSDNLHGTDRRQEFRSNESFRGHAMHSKNIAVNAYDRSVRLLHTITVDAGAHEKTNNAH